MSRKNIVIINIQKCKGCKLCVNECPQKIIMVSDEVNKNGYRPAQITDPSKCTGCTFCAIVCPDAIIEVIREED